MSNNWMNYNPYYPYGQVQQPYMPNPMNMNQAVQYQQPIANTVNRTSISGHMISNPNEITPQEVPMDGSISLFPMQDGSAVYGKSWDSSGQIKTVRYVPDTQSDISQSTDPFDALNARLDSIENLIRNRHNRYNKPYRKNYDENSETGKGEVNDKS